MSRTVFAPYTHFVERRIDKKFAGYWKSAQRNSDWMKMLKIAIDIQQNIVNFEC